MTALALPYAGPATVLADCLDALAPVGLDELLAEAELLTRVDRKYVVAVDDLPGLLAGVPAGTRALELGGARVFGYRSTYLDTPDLDSFRLAGTGRRRRWKVRTRAYLDSGSTWLEVKTRAARGATVKQRVPHEERALGPDGRAFVDRALADGGIGATGPLEPVLVTGYRRATLLLPTAGRPARVTIDVDLGWTSLRPGGGDLDRPRLAVVETKTGSTPSAVDRLLWAHGRRPVSLSKYAVGLAALDPSLPRLRWARTLRRDLDVRPQPSRPTTPRPTTPRPMGVRP